MRCRHPNGSSLPEAGNLHHQTAVRLDLANRRRLPLASRFNHEHPSGPMAAKGPDRDRPPGRRVGVSRRHSSPCHTMKPSIRIRLSVMMFLEYVIWASWYVTMGRYLENVLNFSKEQIGLVYNTTAVAAIISPIFVGMVADRFFSTEKVLCAAHLLGGAFALLLTRVETFGVFYAVLLAHTLCYMPTLALTNSISFHQMKDPSKEFPSIRVLGTISWIVTVWGIGQLAQTDALKEFDVRTPAPFAIAGVASILLAFYSLTLPHTPPKAKGQKVSLWDVLGLDALRMLREPSFAVFILSAFLICIPLSFYFSLAPICFGDLGLPNATGATSYGQMSEIFFMLVMPWFFARLGVKWMLGVGMLSWGLRYLLFLLGYESGAFWPLYVGIVLHGICYDFFFVTAYIYTDQKAPEAMRAKAQGFIALVTLGLGMLAGTTLSGKVSGWYSFPAVTPEKSKPVADASAWVPGNYVMWRADGETRFGALEALPETNAGETARVRVYVPAGDRGYEPGEEVLEVPLNALEKPLPRWDSIWKIAAYGALAVLMLFVAVFREPKAKTAEPAAPTADATTT
ncbi:MAG: MFS transporter [Verrucomicrobia bacterium]|nr:MAG: MFS transporter [Verrucomicrobiota bacterium]